MLKKKICWVSAGVSSFIAGLLAGDIDEWIYIDIADQHKDSYRFLKDCEKITGKKTTILRSSRYRSVEDCFRVFGGFRNARNGFAPCTNWLKCQVRLKWELQHPGERFTYVWGFDCREIRRAEQMVKANPQAEHVFPLIEGNLSKQNAHAMLMRMGIRRPKMYDLGYPNNNCIGCCKGGISYWNKIRVDFPEIFKKRARLERELGFSMLKDKNGPIFLDELSPDRGSSDIGITPVYSIMCMAAETELEEKEKKTG